MILSIIGVLVVVLSICLLSLVLGQIIWKKLGVEDDAPFAFMFASWFFLGLSTFIVLFSLLQIVLGAQVGLWFAIVIGIAVAATSFSCRELLKEKRFLYGFGLWSGAFFVLDILHALVPLPRVVLDPVQAPFAYGFGAVVHSFRAENIALAIVSGNALPFLNQNFAQSVLAAMPHLLGFNLPQFSLLVWHALIIAMAGMFVWGCARKFLTAKVAVIPTALVLVGNTAISYRYISVTDTSHAILTSQNYETVIGLVTLTLSVIIFRTILLKGYTLVRAAALSILVLSWSIIGAHLSLILISIAFILVLVHFVNEHIVNRALKGVSTIVLSVVVGTILFGGMFALHAPQSNIIGAKSVIQEGKPFIELRWFRTVEAEFHAALKISYLAQLASGSTVNQSVESPQNVAVPETVISSSSQNVSSSPTLYTRTYALIQELKQNDIVWGLVRIARSLQLVFLSLAALALGYWYIRSRQPGASTWFLESYMIIAPLFLVGWILSSVVFIYGQYGEVSRFFAPGVSASLFLLGIILAALMGHRKKIVRWAAVLVVLVSIVPVLFDYFVVGIGGNFVLPSVDHMRYEALGVGAPIEKDDVLSFEERFDLLFSPAVTRGAKPFVQ